MFVKERRAAPSASLSRGRGTFLVKLRQRVAFALSEGDFPAGDYLWSVTALVVVGSIVVHGITATPAMLLLDSRRRREAAHRGAEVEETPV